MRNKVIVGILGLTVVVAGIAAFAAFTAQIVNLEAHVEKEIEVAAVKDCRQVGLDTVCDEDTGQFGTVIPQEIYDKFIEVTLSRSFIDGQNQFDDVVYAVLWECKQFDPEQDLVDNLTGEPVPDDPLTPVVEGPGDGWPDCRVNPTRGLDHDGDNVVEDCKVAGCDLPHDGNLDDYLRNYADVIVDVNRCLTDNPPTGVNDGSLKPEEKKVDLLGYGTIFRSSETSKKCFYNIKLLAPPCEGEFNPFTDPNGPNVKTIDCHFDKPSSDPQTWEHFADIGDDFKIQVIEHSLAPR